VLALAMLAGCVKEPAPGPGFAVIVDVRKDGAVLECAWPGVRESYAFKAGRSLVRLPGPASGCRSDWSDLNFWAPIKAER
jgi:hypothetical protein